MSESRCLEPVADYVCGLPAVGDTFRCSDHLPDEQLNARARSLVCPICNAKPGELCASIVDASRYFDIPHAARRELARRSA